jgi:hypothetical protein
VLAQQLAGAIAAAPLSTLDDLSRDVWRALAAGMLDDTDAQQLAEVIHARRTVARALETAGRAQEGRPGPARSWSYFPPPRPPQGPQSRARSLVRRRRLAASGPLPPHLAARFTCGELAALRIVADQVRASGGRHVMTGSCARTLPEIAARAGVSVSTARNAIRTAARLGLLTVEERRRHCAPNLANVVRIVSAEWLAWLVRGRGFKNLNPTDRLLSSREKRGGWNGRQSPSGGHRRALFERAVE